nr:dihydropteroate synthase [Actinomyces oris]
MTILPAAAPAPLPGWVPRDRTLLMGVLNVTPDSFSDGGRWADPETAVAHARELIAQGADIIDVGGESTRPGAQRVDVDTEISRVLPVVRALLADGAGGADRTGSAGSAIISVDTIHAATAEAAIDAGAHIINDVSGGLADPAMHGLIARTGVVYVCQHWRGDPETMDRLTDYPGGVVAGVEAELRERLGELDAAGVDRAQVVLDPGLGFAKTHAQSWELLAATSRLIADLGQPLLVGSSRKRFLAQAAEAEATPVQRDAVTAATTALAAASGAWAVRVHEVPANRAAVRTASLWKEHQ